MTAAGDGQKVDGGGQGAAVRCSGTLGSKPSWMSWGQYDPCRCRLDEGHDGDHWCEHLSVPDPRVAVAAASGDGGAA